ncbi:hypothetical protein [Dietzia cinnamea]|uniref:hypothetical protein n=1 Tax=Dietzia cinnamea TaxID=321318 RepID=UPI00223BF495|nr:hypothetical protein [Dietzia cinnamea]MCT2173008.1 hypothetical protein [Dietzia cinnamea]
MSPGWVLTVLALLPLLAWVIAAAVIAARRWWRRRGDDRARRLRLARMLRGGELVVVPTSDIDLPEATVLAVAADAGYRLVGYERADTPLCRRIGVFVRIGGEVDAVISGVPAPR